MSDSNHTLQIARLNDAFRSTFLGGQVMLTSGVLALPESVKTTILKTVQSFNAFTPDNDPHEEHDFGAFAVEGKRLFWKIDYYDPTLAFGSENPADPKQTKRVLTIMLADEY